MLMKELLVQTLSQSRFLFSSCRKDSSSQNGLPKDNHGSFFAMCNRGEKAPLNLGAANTIPHKAACAAVLSGDGMPKLPQAGVEDVIEC